jgi:hypothetical protein
LFAVTFLLLRQPTLGRLDRGVAATADPEELRRHVDVLTVRYSPRDSDHPENLSAAADYIAHEMGRHAEDVSRQTYRIRGIEYANVIARFGDAGAPLVVGAHYDSFGDFGENPGADDNASGTAGLLELVRLASVSPPSVPVEFVAYSTEEPPYFGSSSMGSAVHAHSLVEGGGAPTGMICLEMIGYFSEKQPWPHWFLSILYPDHGGFIGVAGGWADRKLARYVKNAFRGASSLPIYSFTGPSEMIDASDQRSYWVHGWPAVMVTDTAFVRNPNYHSPDDTADTLDYERMAAVVDGVANALVHAQEFSGLDHRKLLLGAV